MTKHLRHALCLLLIVSGCATQQPAPVSESGKAIQVESGGKSSPTAAQRTYTVKKGDTLHSIALDHGVDYRELAAWNNIENVNRIRVGQSLRLNATGANVAPTESVTGATEVRAISADGPVVARSLDTPAATPVPPASTSAPAVVSSQSEGLKRSPKGGKLPYSEEALARLKAQDAAPVAVTTTPPVAAVATEKPVATQTPPVAAAGNEGDIDWAWPTNGKILATFSEGAAGETNKGVDLAGKLGDPVQAAASGKVVYVGSGLRGYGNLVIVRHNSSFLSAYAHNSKILVKEGDTVTRGQKIAELGNSDADQPKLHFEVRLQGKPVDPLKYLPAR